MTGMSHTFSDSAASTTIRAKQMLSRYKINLE